MLIAVTIKSAYLSRSLVDRCPEKSAEPSASSSVDLNTSRSVWFCAWWREDQLRFRWVGDRCPSRHLFEIECHVLLNLIIATQQLPTLDIQAEKLRSSFRGHLIMKDQSTA